MVELQREKPLGYSRSPELSFAYVKHEIQMGMLDSQLDMSTEITGKSKARDTNDHPPGLGLGEDNVITAHCMLQL